MSPNSVLNGLNIISQPSDASSDAIDLLQGVPSYADLAAQLDLWTNVSFDSDEPFVAADSFTDVDGGKFSDKEEGSAGEEMKRKRALKGGRKFPLQSPSGETPEDTQSQDLHHQLRQQQQQQLSQAQPQQPQLPTAAASLPNPFLSQAPFDFSAFLALTGMDPMKMNPFLAFPPFLPQQQQPQQQPTTSSFPFQLPVTAPLPTTTTSVLPETASEAPSSTSAPSAPKRARTRGSSTSTHQKSKPSVSSEIHDSPTSPLEELPEEDDHGSSMTPAEDKRRRNTQASARFRLKKKEREAAMEQKCKELSIRVSELEKECEALRRENGWLKGLVVGVTGGNGAMPNMGLPPMPPMTSGLQIPSASGLKRKTDEA